MENDLSTVLILSEPEFEYENRKQKSYLYYFFEKLFILSFIIGLFSLVICLMYNKDANDYDCDYKSRDIYRNIAKVSSVFMIVSFSISLLSLSYLVNS